MDLQLKGGKALITGGSKGIGFAIAQAFADEGCNVAICSRGQENVDQAVAALSAKGVNVYGDAVDIGDADALKGWVEAAADALGGIDTFVSNATGPGGTDENGWMGGLTHDIFGLTRGVAAAMGHLEASSNASVVAISSTAALEKFIAAMPYNAMKAAVLQHAGALAFDLAPKGIRVNCVTPGPIFIKGGSWDRIKQGVPPLYEGTLAQIPLGRMGAAAEVAAQVVFLASPLAGFTTGTNVVIDGGITKRIQF